MSTTNPVPKLYQSVVDDVINGVREAFLDEGVDEQVLTELQQLWESKLQQSKAIEGPNKDQEKLMAVYTQVHNTVLKQQQQHQQQKQQLQHSFHHSQQQQNSANTAGASQPVAASQQIFSQNQSNISNHGQAAALALPSGMLPQQLSNLSQLPAGQTITLQTVNQGMPSHHHPHLSHRLPFPPPHQRDPQMGLPPQQNIPIKNLNPQQRPTGVPLGGFPYQPQYIPPQPPPDGRLIEPGAFQPVGMPVRAPLAGSTPAVRYFTMQQSQPSDITPAPGPMMNLPYSAESAPTYKKSDTNENVQTGNTGGETAVSSAVQTCKH